METPFKIYNVFCICLLLSLLILKCGAKLEIELGPCSSSILKSERTVFYFSVYFSVSSTVKLRITVLSYRVLALFKCRALEIIALELPTGLLLQNCWFSGFTHDLPSLGLSDLPEVLLPTAGAFATEWEHRETASDG